MDKDLVHWSPVGVGFVRPSVRRGVLPALLRRILAARQAVKKNMKLQSDEAVKKAMHSRQLGGCLWVFFLSEVEIRFIIIITFNNAASTVVNLQEIKELGLEGKRGGYYRVQFRRKYIMLRAALQVRSLNFA